MVLMACAIAQHFEMCEEHDIKESIPIAPMILFVSLFTIRYIARQFYNNENVNVQNSMHMIE